MTKGSTAKAPPGREHYHHGNLTEALVEAAIALIDERGVAALSVREVAKRAGVSPGAPFRHFSSKTALLTAVAEQAMQRFFDAVTVALADWPQDDPVGALRAMGTAYLAWAIGNPIHFHVISARDQIDFHGSALLISHNEALRRIMQEWIERARVLGLLRPGLDTQMAMLTCRAFIYGLARIWCDGHLRDWQGDLTAEAALSRGLDAIIDGLMRSP